MKWGWQRGLELCVWGHAGPCNARWPGEVFPSLVIALRRELGSGIKPSGLSSHLQVLHQLIWPQFLIFLTPQSCCRGRGGNQLTQLIKGRLCSVMTGHPSHPDPTLALIPTPCHSASSQEVIIALLSSDRLLPVTYLAPLSPNQRGFPDLPTQRSCLPHPAFLFLWHLSPLICGKPLLIAVSECLAHSRAH